MEKGGDYWRRRKPGRKKRSGEKSLHIILIGTGAGAEKGFKKALELNPHSPLSLDGQAAFLEFQRRFAEAITASKTALDLEHLAASGCHSLKTFHNHTFNPKEADRCPFAGHRAS